LLSLVLGPRRILHSRTLWHLILDLFFQPRKKSTFLISMIHIKNINYIVYSYLLAVLACLA
jgi:hypothetical protein